jgi:hypothetical protein
VVDDLRVKDNLKLCLQERRDVLSSRISPMHLRLYSITQAKGCSSKPAPTAVPPRRTSTVEQR